MSSFSTSNHLPVGVLVSLNAAAIIGHRYLFIIAHLTQADLCCSNAILCIALLLSHIRNVQSKTCACLFPAAPQQQPVDPRKPRAGPGAILSQPLPSPGAVSSQPSTSGPPGQGVQPWRPSPSFREQQQQQQQQQPSALHPHTSSHPLPMGNAVSIDPHQQSLHPQDPRRARQQQQTQLPPPPLAGIQHKLNGFHVSGAGQAADGRSPSYGQQQGTGSSGLLITHVLVVAHVCMVKTCCIADALLLL